MSEENPRFHFTHALDTIDSPLNQELEKVYAIGYDHYLRAKYADARPLFEYLVMQALDNATYWFALGAACLKLKDWHVALEAFFVAANLNPNNPYAHLHAADCLIALEDKKHALLALDEAIMAAKKDSAYDSLLKKLQLMKQCWIKETL